MRNAAVFHYASLLRVTGIPVEVAVRHLRRRAARGVRRAAGIRAFDTLAECSREVDMVDNCTPGYAHEPVSHRRLEAGST